MSQGVGGIVRNVGGGQATPVPLTDTVQIEQTVYPADAATVTLDASQGSLFVLELSGLEANTRDITVTNLTDGAVITLVLVQPDVGPIQSWTWDGGAGFVWPASTPEFTSGSTQHGFADLVQFVYVEQLDALFCTGKQLGYAI